MKMKSRTHSLHIFCWNFKFFSSCYCSFYDYVFVSFYFYSQNGFVVYHFTLNNKILGFSIKFKHMFALTIKSRIVHIFQ